jgi:peptidylprolyl isomerase/peptidyl-prolyl cis-trans isomerase B (cyclophilin B)
LAALERQKRRRSALRRAIVVIFVAALAGGIYAATRPGPAKAVVYTTSANCPTPFTATSHLTKHLYSAAPPMTIDPTKSYTATVTTDAGPFTIALDAKDSPNTVNNFVFLAEHHFYDCVVFHRVITGFMDQTGDPTGTGQGGPGYKFGDENLKSSYTAGEVAMANSGPNTNGSQFFVLAAPYTPPSGGYSLFGQVTSGQSVVDKINQDGSQSGTPNALHRIVKVVVTSS